MDHEWSRPLSSFRGGGDERQLHAPDEVHAELGVGEHVVSAGSPAQDCGCRQVAGATFGRRRAPDPPKGPRGRPFLEHPQPTRAKAPTDVLRSQTARSRSAQTPLERLTSFCHSARRRALAHLGRRSADLPARRLTFLPTWDRDLTSRVPGDGAPSSVPRVFAAEARDQRRHVSCKRRLTYEHRGHRIMRRTRGQRCT